MAGMWSRDRSMKGSFGTSEGSAQYDVLYQRYDLFKLNPKCHMNYSIIFKEISFFSETSSSPHSTTHIMSLVPDP